MYYLLFYSKYKENENEGYLRHAEGSITLHLYNKYIWDRKCLLKCVTNAWS